MEEQESPTRWAVLMQGFNVFDTAKYVGKISKKYQAALLGQLEVMIVDEALYAKVRKAVLDSYNDYARDVVSEIFGDIES